MNDRRVTKNTVSYLGSLIKIARKEHSISQEELAERVNGMRETIQKIESGNTQIAIGVVFEACFILGIPLMGCDKEHINNLSRMLSYINRLLPDNISSKNTVVYDDF